MLVVRRRDSESILIRPNEDIDPQLTLANLFENGPIEIKILSARDKRVTIGVEAPKQLSIWCKSAPRDGRTVNGLLCQGRLR